MIPVTEALDHLFALTGTLPSENVPLSSANRRVLAEPVIALRDQPPFDASAMDGYAVISSDANVGTTLTVVGESAAGHRYEDALVQGQCVRIFTGAPLPVGADRVVIQEDVERTGDQITLRGPLGHGTHIRPAGGDFRGGTQIAAPRILRPSDIALMAAMNIAEVPVTRKPRVAIMATGDELVMPGEMPGPDQIIASNSFGPKAMIEDLGADVRLLPIARDTESSLKTAFDLSDDCDLVITIGGASVGDHDLVGKVAVDLGMKRSFYKIAMRPGKPLMAGRLTSGAMMIGLPGNPVSAMVCGHVFVAPVIRAMLGLGQHATPKHTMTLATDIPANGPREHYMRATIQDGALHVADRQDSSLLTVLADANALIVRPVNGIALKVGDQTQCILI
jgi:molybdopterin molybdotransferase